MRGHPVLKPDNGLHCGLTVAPHRQQRSVRVNTSRSSRDSDSAMRSWPTHGLLLKWSPPKGAETLLSQIYVLQNSRPRRQRARPRVY